ncbi:MAG: ATP-binding protein [Clostridia bacterium]|nr:ATP-binding protein [Clostridia bacterium]
MSKFKQEAHAVLASRRFRERDRVEKLQDVLLQDEIYRSLNSQKIDLRADMARLASLNQDISAQKNQYSQIVAEMEKRMNELGINKEDLAVSYVCPLCKDTGFVDGKECACLKQLVYARLRAHCGSLVTDESDFDNVDFSVYPENQKERFQKFYRFLKITSDKFPNNENKIIGIYGPVGVGKTHGISVFANNLMKRGYSVFYLNSAEMNSLFLKYHLAREADKADIWEPLIDCDLLILDDLGAEQNINNVTQNYLYCLLNERHHKTTVFTSNLDEELLREKYDDRVFSRLGHKLRSTIIKLKGKDLRFN